MKHTGIKQYWLALLAGLFITAALVARAELTATVYPGYQFSAGERATVSTLNLLGTPTILISGTLGGTNVALGAGTVSGTMLMDSLAGAGLTWDGNAPRGLMIADAGVGVGQLSSTNFGLGLSGGGGDVVRVLYDTNSITLNSSGQLSINTNLFGNGLVYSNNVLSVAGNFTSGEYAITNTGVIANIAHALGAAPVWVRWVLVCKTNELGYIAGEEVDVYTATSTTDGDNAFMTGSNSTNVFLVRNENVNSTGVRLLGKTSGIETYATLTRWKAKAYARR